MKIVLIAIGALTAGVFFSTEIKTFATTKSAEAASYVAKTTAKAASEVESAAKKAEAKSKK